MINLSMSASQYDELVAHLFPPENEKEQAAFLFASPSIWGRNSLLSVQSIRCLDARDFEQQASSYVELTDARRAALIKQAHVTNTSLVEAHSHLGPWPAVFSDFDISGLRETVRHMLWRLKGKPYGALVFSESGFDGLAWTEKTVPQQIEEIRAGNSRIKSTKLSITRF
jgi:hypothetical protein